MLDRLHHFGWLPGPVGGKRSPSGLRAELQEGSASPGLPHGGLGSAKAPHLAAAAELNLRVLSTAERSEVESAADSWDICLHQERALV